MVERDHRDLVPPPATRHHWTGTPVAPVITAQVDLVQPTPQTSTLVDRPLGRQGRTVERRHILHQLDELRRRCGPAVGLPDQTTGTLRAA